MTRLCGDRCHRNGISTHTPLAGRDQRGGECDGKTEKFLLTRPSRDVTDTDQATAQVDEISTHTPLAGRDHQKNRRVWCHKIFLLTRPSRDVTVSGPCLASGERVFLLTRPSRDVTYTPGGFGRYLYDFYSHAPRGT